jgi:hypothetical protein
VAPRKVPVHPVQAAADAREAAKAAASRKAEVAPDKLTEAEVMLLSGKKVLELGNAGKLRHVGLGVGPLKSAAPAATKKIPVTRSAKARLTDADLDGMSGEAISKAMAAGMVAGVGARRRPRGR